MLSSAVYPEHNLNPSTFQRSDDSVSPLFSTHTRCSQLAEKSNTLSPAFATHTDFSAVSPVFATHTKTAGVYPNNSHSGTHTLSSLKSTPHSFHELTNCPFRNSFPLTSLQMPGGMRPVAASFLKDYFNFSVVFPNLPICKPFSWPTFRSARPCVCSPGADMLGFALKKIARPSAAQVPVMLTSFPGCLPAAPLWS